MRSLINRLNIGNAKAFHLLLKYAPPNRPRAPIGVKLAQGVICAAFGIRIAAANIIKRKMAAKRGLIFCMDILIGLNKLDVGKNETTNKFLTYW